MPDYRRYRLWRAAALAVLLATQTACDDGTGEGPLDADLDLADIDEEADADAADADDGELPADDEGSVRFDLDLALTDDFFAFPYPSDLRRREDGVPDLSSFPTWRALGNLLSLAIETVEESGSGFSPLSAAYFTFNTGLDPDTLPANVEATRSDSASVYLLDVTPGSPTYGQRWPATITYNDEGGGYWPPRTLAIRPLYGLPLRTATTYAAVVTTEVRAADGDSLRPPGVLGGLAEALSGADPAAPLTESFRPLYDTLVELGEAPETLLAATVFTTSDPGAQLVALRDWMRESLPAPQASDVRLTDTRAGFTVYEGTFDSVEFFTGEAPYTGFGEGRFAFDEDGQPAFHAAVDLTFSVSVPDGPMPEGGWPIVLYGHGLGENHRGFVQVAAPDLARRGIAVLGIDPPLQGDRNPTGRSDRDLIVDLAVSNIVAGREILRQGVCDEIRAAQLVQAGLTIPAEVAANGEVIGFDPSRMAFMGHSEGAQIGALLVGIEPNVGPAVFSAGGGGAAVTMLELDTAGIDVARVVSAAVGLDPSVETLDLDHPVTTVVIQPLLDAADPLHLARRIFLEPIDGVPHDLVMLEGFHDALTPPASTEALASAAGLPIAEPVGRPIEGLELQGIESVPLPARANLPEVGGHRATGALLQFPDDDHYIVYTNAGARAQLFDFLGSALAGEAEIPVGEVGK